MEKPKVLASGWHNTFGWLRRPELDVDGVYAYENPDGTIIDSTDRAHAARMHLTAYEDQNTGEKYVSVSRCGEIATRSKNRNRQNL
jgi:hypothetical protein